MGRVRPPMQVIYFCALLRAPFIPDADVETVLEAHFGPIILRSAAVPFVQTTYYEREMGSGLTRSYLGFASLRSMGDLAAAKHTTNELEAQWTVDGRRRVNLDPGYLDHAKVVLVTTKDYSHRLYLGGGMYAEVTLQYRHKSYQPWEWTYPDYRQPVALEFFNQLREMYKMQLQQVLS
ncbi:DUF4416 family protein [Candidatus Entotheonella palauensis]|uniref:GTP-binding protein n=1 Tax=Candidatus Entotheonella gemina TaxID=1429439 RepID=W4LTT9_9BACT|nr:DUF4416 family protein [Candidatus Entotheonella palauensis]ETX01141.1 MAG: hypothetical protein ETSY2_37770 [Candidatus Entotheonella gemina]